MTATELNQLQQISDQSRTLAEFYDRFLEHVCKELSAVGGVAWECSQHPLRPISQYQAVKDQPLKMQISESKHQELLDLGLKSPEPFFTNGQPAILMTRMKRGDAIDLIELFVPAGLTEAEYQQRLKGLVTICHAAAGITRRRMTPELNQQIAQASVASQLPSDKNTATISSAQLDEYTHVLHQSLDPRATASKIANETRRILDCDRVTVFKVIGRRTSAVAVSGQPNVNRRSNAVSRLERLAQRVLLTKQTFWYPSEQPQPPQIEKRLNEYLTHASTRSMTIVPIFDDAQFAEKKPGEHHQREPRLIGGIAIEQCDRQWDTAAITAPVEMLTRHSGDAFRNAYQHRQLFAYPLWYWLGKSKIIFAARHLSKTMAAMILLTLLGLIMAFVQTDFRMTCEGQLLPSAHRQIFANIDGVVESVLVDHGDEVDKDQPLIQIENLELDQQIQTTTGKINELKEVIMAARSTLSGRSSRSQDNQQQENVSAMKAQLASAKLELELLQAKSKRLAITSPIAGKVVTYNVRDKLVDRPVQRVESLLEVADLNGDWIVELSLPDRKIGHVIEAFAQNDSEPLQVEFILAADPEQTYRGVLSEMGHGMTMTPDKGHCMTLKGAIEDPDFDLKQLRSGVSAYIQCGQRSVGYTWFHSLWEFVQAKVLFPLF